MFFLRFSFLFIILRLMLLKHLKTIKLLIVILMQIKKLIQFFRYQLIVFLDLLAIDLVYFLSFSFVLSSPLVPRILPVLRAAIRPTLRPGGVPLLTVEALPMC